MEVYNVPECHHQLSYGHRQHAQKIEGKFGHVVSEICGRQTQHS